MITKPFAVQKEALRRGAHMPGFAYFMEQGLGKTLTTYLDFLDKVPKKEATRLVVVCPNSFKSGWVEDAHNHGIDPDFFVWGDDQNESYFRAWMKRGFNKPPCFIVNWEAIRSDYVQKMIADFSSEVASRSMIAFDESIKAKTYNSAQTKSGIAISKHFTYRRILSGKPITKGPDDLWGQYRLIGQLDGRNYFSFRNAFCKMGGFKGKSVVGTQNEEQLAKLIEPYCFRATKADWTDLPPKLWTEREYKLSLEQQRQYDSMYHDFVLWLSDDEVVTVEAAITKYIKLAQIQCGWIYDETGKSRELIEPTKNPRLNLLQEIIDEEVTGKTCIVYHHKPVFEALLKRFTYLQPAFIKGGMSSVEVEEQKRRFNNDRSCRTILLQDDASKYGHTLLGHGEGTEDRCFTTLFFENSYSLDTRSQIEDRNHRHGQTAEAVLYLDLVGTPLDRDVVKALQRKESIFQAIFGALS